MTENPLDKKKQEVLDQILFISLPENMDTQMGDFNLDPGRLLPIEVSGDREQWSFEELSWEMIIAGMLKILAYQPDHDDANYYREFILTLKPEIVGELTQTAILKANNGDFELAEEIFLALYGLQPNEQRALLNLALHYDKRAEANRKLSNDSAAEFYEERAYHWYRTLGSQDDTLEEAYLYAGYFYARTQNYLRAQDAFHSYLEFGKDPQHKKNAREILDTIEGQNLVDVLFKEAYDFILMSREGEALEKIEQFLERNPKVWNAWFLKGWAYRRLRQFTLALPAFQRALELGGKNADTLNESAICQLELGQLDAARGSLFEAMKLEPENTKVISNLGILSLKEGNTDEARAYFQSVLEFDPEDPLALQYLQQLDS